MPELTDERLAAILASVADHLVVPPATATATATATDPAAGAVAGDPSSNGSGDGTSDRIPAVADVRGRRRRTQQARRPVRLLVAAAVLVVASVVGTVVAPVREAVAGWLGIGSTEVVRVGVGEGDPGDLPYLGTGLRPVDRATAERRLGAPLPAVGDDEALGGPAQVLATPPEGGVIMAWADGATTLWVRPAEQPPAETISKLLTFDDRIERVDGIGEDAAMIEGAHVLVTPQRRLAAGTVIVWVDDGFEYRIESDLGRARMEAIARSVGPGE